MGIVLDGEDTTCDLETTGLSSNDDILGYTLCDQYGNSESHKWTPKSAVRLQEVADQCALVFHNAAFDVRMLRVHGIRITNFECTQVMHYLLFPDWRQHGLDHCCKHMNVPGKFEKPKSWAVWDEEMERYCEQDGKSAMSLYLKLSALMAEDDKVALLYYTIDLPYINSLIQFEHHGMHIDTTALYSAQSALDEAFSELLTKVSAYHPLVPGEEKLYKGGQYKRLGFITYDHCTLEPFSYSSDAHVAYVLKGMGWKPLKQTKTGKDSVSKDTLSELDIPLAAEIVEIRELAKMQNTFVTNIMANLDEYGCVHAPFNNTVTVTGRLSSGGSGINLQNMPTRGKHGQAIRSLFDAPEGYVFVGTDLAAIEARILGHYLVKIYDDWSITNIIVSGVDFHQANADAWGVTRAEAKTLLYAILYGAGAVKVGGGDAKRGKMLLGKVAENSPNIMRLKEDFVRYATSNGGLAYTEFGRRLVYPMLVESHALAAAEGDEKLARGLMKRAERQVFNALLQGTAADVNKILSVGMDADQCSAYNIPVPGFSGSLELFTKYDGIRVADVHDEAIGYCPTGNVEYLVPQLQALYRTPVLSGCPIDGTPKVGNNWYETH